MVTDNIVDSSVTAMATTADHGERPEGGRGDDGDDAVCRKWVSLTCDTQFDIGRGRVRCDYTTADFMVPVHGDAVLLVPVAFRLASQMVAHAVLADRGDGHVEIAVRRPSIRCAVPYRFAYVDGRLFDVMGVSDAFTFVHHDGTCDCSDGAGADSTTGPPTTTISTHRRTDAVSVNMNLFVSFLMNMRSSAPQCPACGSPSNYRQVLEYLTENVNHLSDVDSNIERERIKYIYYVVYVPSNIDSFVQHCGKQNRRCSGGGRSHAREGALGKS